MLHPYCIGGYSIVSILPANYFGFFFVFGNVGNLFAYMFHIVLFQVKVGLVPATSIANAVINKRNCKNLH